MKLAEIADLQRTRLADLTVGARPPLLPPRSWFGMPEPEAPAPLAVSADGHLYGHAALWDTCHTGKPGKCVTPPRSRSGYRFFLTGSTECAEGDLVPTGRITLGTGHAALTASPRSAAEHYENTGSVVADVTATDGKYGI
jgi:hypothetical protein